MGPCKEWHETILTSSGRYFSNAVFSGALTEVCPATMAPTFVAERMGIPRKIIRVTANWMVNCEQRVGGVGLGDGLNGNEF